MTRRRALLEASILPKLSEPIRVSPLFKASVADLIASVKAQRLEGLVANRANRRYEPGRRSGAWQKMRVDRGQEFVIGGYTVGGNSFDALIFGYYEEGRLLYTARTQRVHASGAGGFGAYLLDWQPSNGRGRNVGCIGQCSCRRFSLPCSAWREYK